jgi:hypothetical protein
MKRTLSLAFAAIALVGFPAWAWIESAHVAEAMRREHGWVCGMPMMAILILAVVGAAAASAFSLAFGTWAYRGLPAPRPARRFVELVVISLPLVLLMGIALTLFVLDVVG